MKLEIFNVELAVNDTLLLAAAINACLRWNTAFNAAIYVNARVPMDAPEHKHPGWVEYDVAIWRHEGCVPMRLGVIQRTPGAEIEVHS